MTDQEIDAMAQGIFMYLVEHCKVPVDALGVIICITLKYYDAASNPECSLTIEEFSKRYERDLVEIWKHRTIINEGKTETLQ